MRIVLNETGDTLLIEREEREPWFKDAGFKVVELGQLEVGHYRMFLYEYPGNFNLLVCPNVALRMRVPKSINTPRLLEEWCMSLYQNAPLLPSPAAPQHLVRKRTQKKRIRR